MAAHQHALVLPITPSPFSLVANSGTGWSSRPPSIYVSTLFLRALALVFSFASALSLATLSRARKTSEGQPSTSTFTEYPKLLYSFIVDVLVFLYSAYQLLKGVCDMAHRGFLVSDKASDYISFVVDQMKETSASQSMKAAIIISLCMSMAAFLVILPSSLFSGYKLCKRIVW
ncbi:CASP-like protein 4A4 isoform X2 [Diospyros lotus]|uniref:CASP-like protein 4A4 isoform X2 n=1 Tax=Diospyros lotus TaxID=55363 RepID=UPI002259F975|nr:CASP-like protein 4A4 isoform X2 [Diospyros lotus]